MATSQCLKSALLTSRPLDVEILQKLSADVYIEKRNQLLYELLTCVVPFVQELTPDELLKLREREGDSFILFRAALVRAADNVRTEGAKLNRKSAVAIYSDIVEPDLAKLNIAVSKARRGLVKSARRTIIAWTCAISFGLYYGLLPEATHEAAKTLGFTKVLAEMLSKMMNDSDAEESIRGENMYFLWKIRQAASRKN